MNNEDRLLSLRNKLYSYGMQHLPRTAKLYRYLQTDPTDSITAELIEEAIEKQENRAKSGQNPFLIPERMQVTPGQVPIAHISGDEFNLHVNLNRELPHSLVHCGLFGPTDSGKTTAAVIRMRQFESIDIPILAFDPAGQMHEKLGPDRDRWNVVYAKQLRLAFLRPPHSGISAKVWGSKMLSHLCKTLGLEFTLYYLQDCLGKLCDAHSCDTDSSNTWPTLKSLRDSLYSEKASSYSKKGQRKENALLVLNALLAATGNMLTAVESDPLHILAQEHTIVNCEDISTVDDRFLSLLMTYVIEWFGAQ